MELTPWSMGEVAAVLISNFQTLIKDGYLNISCEISLR